MPRLCDGFRFGSSAMKVWGDCRIILRTVTCKSILSLNSARGSRLPLRALARGSCLLTTLAYRWDRSRLSLVVARHSRSQPHAPRPGETCRPSEMRVDWDGCLNGVTQNPGLLDPSKRMCVLKIHCESCNWCETCWRSETCVERGMILVNSWYLWKDEWWMEWIDSVDVRMWRGICWRNVVNVHNLKWIYYIHMLKIIPARCPSTKRALIMPDLCSGTFVMCSWHRCTPPSQSVTSKVTLTAPGDNGVSMPTSSGCSTREAAVSDSDVCALNAEVTWQRLPGTCIGWSAYLEAPHSAAAV